MDTSIKEAPEYYRCASEDELFLLGERLASRLTPQTTVLLKGTLGAGKTLLVRGMMSYFGVSPGMVASPSFAIVHDYPASIPIKHLDLYRITDLDSWYQLGIEEELGRALLLIEWPQLIEAEIPSPKVEISITIEADNARKVAVVWS
ncbi:tRNA (adenosine(37)-N6)-threonylcarbamoyltransferase complex ATPase subunit type 1 TsaE [Entomospira culicis]|uniref:tRNA threonylcarbamoyladenosine biosynthesis protein TsaE n=1 Tax=Entomospira culicis TaxID=2719989 RepID=A0A968GDP8_9SPIO|nr:tRNA (adenosine(37)-N6)-threonylcarbamoyltransferase complex ATPase subunit type 1 TsaE [Entomospira culicis]NIZ18448.1 tRNA (adenosine(37)-N6)-threonylcarbamoyltransferase complex ATPase subunit type 1 TsaE [Entomospira culicis]NIZ68664.1 tRNA (adenosine(37)-N6)-threonylcarbamoyltransferase complex ATPase subunit type 1 TsaE [Entomospira culicis]WDI37263.1 tRNA (adenosine(37)-N6)-threonylcarbamoyltransferase complex ATPase subunit type 1 TsaE [Entomospira culicis]WDI38892.1 tRNA (adenosine(